MATLADAEARRQMVDDLTRYIEVESPSDDKHALGAGLAFALQLVTDRIGEPASQRMIEGGEFGDIAVLDYDASEGASGRVVILCHYDTVWPLGTLDGWPVEIDGDRLTGPGAFDMKSGLVQALWAIRFARDAGFELPAIRLMLTGDEEIGSPFSRPFIEASAAGHDAALVFEASAEGRIKTQRKGVGLFDVTVYGVEGHAGLDPEKGVSAIDEMARLIVQIHDAADLPHGTTLNMGTLRGGTRQNVKAGLAEGRVDVRVASESEMARIDALFAGLKPHNPQARVEVAGGWNRPVMARSAGTAALFEKAQEAAVALGIDIEEIAVGGASDGNFVAALGIPVLDGLGAVGDGAHARHEWISIDGMVERAELVAHLLPKLASGNLATTGSVGE